MRVLFVCLGNICRSPTAEGVFRQRLGAAGLAERVDVDSCGTAGWHIGKAPDPRTRAAAATRGYDLAALRARQLHDDDFHAFDYLLAMDHANLAELEARRPADCRAHLGLFLDFAGSPGQAVPDPYYGGAEGFDRVLDLVEAAADGLVAELERRLEARP
ncbi:low molecular weight phosphotyrosine protein phosphatase [Halomonas pacifica]|uniref:protein-tyrosine-phosphatase n=1 Tax=Bisbaumannia pacifica TaxID=77098 RepID=A0A510X7D5_9GAMM|nr:low molecular weight protein-tyrosine-phosphatase [Halomonas pacifica]MDC8804276.1 low molecular weight phosphotyrosine protein phosphatase [Halomonas pacifica]GEK47339.1 phosphotyrosine protein phosphatase [Halomonas pacifica]